MANASGAVFAREPARALGGEALVRQLLFLCKNVKNPAKNFRRLRVRRELARQLRPGVLTAREQP